MGFFDSVVLKNKDAQELYETVKSHFVFLIQNPNDAVGSVLPKPSMFNDIATPSQKSAMKHLKKSLEPILPQATLISVDMEGKHLTLEITLALLRTLRKRDEHNQLVWPLNELNLAGTQFLDKKDEKLEKCVLTEMCELIRDSKTLMRVNISNNALGNEFVSKLLIFGVRMSNSVETLIARNTGLDGGVTVPEVLLEMLVSNAEISKLISRRINGSVHRNMSLRKLDFNGHSWNVEALERFCLLAYHCVRITQLDVTSDQKMQTLQCHGKQFSYLLKRNNAVTGIYDDLESNIFKRPFKTKLASFRQSVKENKLKKSGLSSVDEQGPAYKWIAASEDKRNDPFHPTVFPSVYFKSGYAISVGRRAEMQDVLAMRGRFREIISSSGQQVFEDFWAIFDGHGGREAANYAGENLHSIIAAQLDELSNPTPQERCEAIKKAFQQCQKEMAPWNPITGTTVCAVYLQENHRYVINLGDSRCLLYNSRAEVPVFLTRDHKPNEPSEKKRIMSISGGFIEDGRLNGKLSVSRSLGDSSLSPYVSCIPEIDVQEIKPDDEFLVLASDGLWDTLQPEGTTVAERTSSFLSRPSSVAHQLEGCKEVVKIVQCCAGPSAASKKLVEYAYNRGSTDNISVVVIYLKAQGLNKALSRNPTSRKINTTTEQKPNMANPLFRGNSTRRVNEVISTGLIVSSGSQAPSKAGSANVSTVDLGSPQVALSKNTEATESTQRLAKTEEEAQVVVRSALAKAADVKEKEKSSKSLANEASAHSTLNDSRNNLFDDKSQKSLDRDTGPPKLDIPSEPVPQTPASISISKKALSRTNLDAKDQQLSAEDDGRKSSRSLLNLFGAGKKDETTATTSKSYVVRSATQQSVISRYDSHEGLPLQLPIEIPAVKESVADTFVDEMLSIINNMKI